MRPDALRPPSIAPLTLLAGLSGATRIATPEGEVEVARLRVGDLVLTRDGPAPLRRLEALASRVAPVRIGAGTIGHGRPEEDLVVGPATLVLLEGWRARTLYGRTPALVEAHRLVDGDYITEERPRGMTLWTLGFDGPAVIRANGIEVGA